MNNKIIHLGDQLFEELHKREKDFKQFYVDTVQKDPILSKMWSFCFDKNFQEDPSHYFSSRLILIRQNEISKTDFLHLKDLAANAKREDKIFYDCISILTYITERVIIHKDRAKAAGFDIPINKLNDAHSQFYRIVTKNVIREVNYFDLPDFIQEYTKKKDDNGVIHECICLKWLLPIQNKKVLVQNLANYFENYTVELFQNSHHSRDITFGNTSFVRLQDLTPGKYDKNERSKHRYSISIEHNGKKFELINCSLEDKYKHLLSKWSEKLAFSSEKLGDYGRDRGAYNIIESWADSRQDMEIRFFELINEYNPKKHGHLAGYLDQGLKYHRGHLTENISAKKRYPSKGFSEYTEEDIEEGNGYQDLKIDPVLGCEVLSPTIHPENALSQKQDEINYQKIYHKIKGELSPETKRFCKIWLKNPDKTGKQLAELAGISEPMVKKHKAYIKQKAAAKIDNPFKD